MVGIAAEFNVTLHRWREDSYVFQVGGMLFVAFVSEAFSGSRMRRSDLSVVPKILP